MSDDIDFKEEYKKPIRKTGLNNKVYNINENENLNSFYICLEYPICCRI